MAYWHEVYTDLKDRNPSNFSFKHGMQGRRRRGGRGEGGGPPQ